MGRKSAHLKLGTGQKRLGEEKSEQLKGPLWLQEFGKLLLRCQLVFVAWEVLLCLYTAAFIHVDGIYNWQCFPLTGVTAAVAIAAAIDNLTEIPEGLKWNFLNWTFNNKWLQTCKNGLSPLHFWTKLLTYLGWRIKKYTDTHFLFWDVESKS